MLPFTLAVDVLHCLENVFGDLGELLREHCRVVAPNVVAHLGHEVARVNTVHIRDLLLVNQDVGLTAVFVVLDNSDVEASNHISDVLVRNFDCLDRERLADIVGEFQSHISLPR